MGRVIHRTEDILLRKSIRKILAVTLCLAMLMAISVSAEETEKKIVLPDRINVVLFGLSGENEYDTNRTDSIIIVTVDNEYKQLKFTSILRDIKAQIEGHEPQKINAANRYGGHELALQTLNQNFNLDLENYITVNFEQFADLVWILGGVNVELSEAEVAYMHEIAPGYDYVVGTNYLDGWQALQYSRIRKIDSDVVRSGRQRSVLKELVEHISTYDLKDFIALATSFLDIVEETSLTIADVAMLASIPYGEYDIINNHFPDVDKDIDVWGGTDEHGEWVWTFDMDAASVRINDIINNKQPVEDAEY